MICMKKVRFSFRARGKVGRQGPVGSARVHPWVQISRPGCKGKGSAWAVTNYTSFLNTSFSSPIQGPEPPNSWLLFGPGDERFRVSISVHSCHP